jgi:hypothetical protein
MKAASRVSTSGQGPWPLAASKPPAAGVDELCAPVGDEFGDCDYGSAARWSQYAEPRSLPKGLWTCGNWVSVFRAKGLELPAALS